MNKSIIFLQTFLFYFLRVLTAVKVKVNSTGELGIRANALNANRATKICKPFR